MIHIVPATRALLDLVHAKPLPKTVRAVVLIEDGTPLGTAGVYVEEAKQVVFAQFSDYLRRHPRALLRTWRAVKPMLRPDMAAYALADPEIARSAAFLEHIGFAHYEKDLYRWPN